ncbi:hypothetical protein [Paenibacillus odorifer]|uniref:hypothetical protein n=1 Tax=Paenibacillus odorifer TaxID=189426 RepID=UPI00096DD827|nr:hypothetical protein [Paenibacillus odorifer]OMD93531.1 hypothetical protein BSK67_16565 [Paenibacillus odorifer]
MATFTAQILIGLNHTYDGGLINLHHSLYLSENSVARWILCSTDPYMKSPLTAPIGWIPYEETMLEDGILLIGLHVLQDKTLIRMAEEYFLQPYKEVTFLHEGTISREHLHELHKYSRHLFTEEKLILTVFENSTLFKQLKVLQNYSLQVEVCTPIFSRRLDPWTRQILTTGDVSENRKL